MTVKTNNNPCSRGAAHQAINNTDMKQYEYSEQLLKALKGDASKIDLLDVIHNRSLSTPRDVMQLTGLQSFRYHVIFADDEWDVEMRGPNIGIHAIRELSFHINRKDLAPHQKIVSQLLWREIQWIVIGKIDGVFRLITGRASDEDYPDEPAFRCETYEVTTEEMTLAVKEIQKHLAEVS